MPSDVLILEQKDFLNRKYQVELVAYKGRDFFKKVFIFPGQGAAVPSMFRDHYNSSAIGVFFEKADIEAKRLKMSSLPSSYILDPKSIKVDDMPYTRNLALFTLQVGLFYSLLEKDIEPVCLSSHSFGEFACFVSSGIVSFQDMFEIVSFRDKACPPSYHLGFMVAVNSSFEKVKSLFQNELESSVFISNYNSHKQVTLSCVPDFLEALKTRLKNESIGFIVLKDVPQPYHTSLLESSASKFRRFLKGFDFKVSKPDYPFLSSVTCDFLNEKELQKDEVLDILSRQLVQPVHFSQQIEKLYEKGYSHFVEISSQSLCSPFVKNILDQDEHKTSLVEVFFPKPKSEKSGKKIYSSEDSKVLKLIMKTVKAVTGYNIDEISVHSEFHKDLGVDSIKKAEIIFNVSESLNLKNESTGSMFSDVRQIEDVLNYVKEKRKLTYEEKKVKFRSFKESFVPSEISKMDLLNDKPFCEIPIHLNDILSKEKNTLEKTKENLELQLQKAKEISEEEDHLEPFCEKKRILFVLKAYKKGRLSVSDRFLDQDIKKFDTSYEEITERVVHFFSQLSQKLEVLNLPLNLFFVSEESTHPFILALDSFFKSLSYEQESCFYKQILFDNTESFNHKELEILLENEFKDSFCTNIFYKERKRYVKTFEKTKDSLFKIEHERKSKDKLEINLKQKSLFVKKWSSRPENKSPVALFIGGSRGVGHVLAKALLEETKLKLDLENSQVNKEMILYILGRSDESEVSESLKNLEGQVVYKKVDAQDKESFTEVLDEVFEKHGRIDLIVNGSGHEDSERLKDKTKKEIREEFYNKVYPAFHLFNYFLQERQNKEVGQILHHSSVVGEFGNDGQTIYSMANQLIGLMSSWFNKAKGKAISKTLFWPAWDKVGMTEKSGILKKLKLSGVTALSKERGEELFLEQIFNFEDEKVIFLDQENMKQYSGGLEKRKDKIPFETLLSTYDKVKLSDLNLENQDYLRDHKIQGKCIYPGASALALSTYAALTHFKKYPVIKKFEAENILIVPEKPSSLFLESFYSKKTDSLRVEVLSSVRHFSSSFKKKTTETLKEKFDFKEEGKLHAPSLYKKSDIFGPRFRYKSPVFYDNSKRVLITLLEDKMWNYTGFRVFDLLQQWFELAFQTMSVPLMWETGFVWIPQKVEEVVFEPEKLSSTLYTYTKHLKREESLAYGTPCIFNDRKEIFLEIRGLHMKVFAKGLSTVEESFVKI